MKQEPLFPVNRKRISKPQIDSQWAAKAIEHQGDIVLGVVSRYLSANGISRMSVEAIDKAMVKEKHDFALHHIKSGIKNLLGRELLGKEGATYYVIKKEKYID